MYQISYLCARYLYKGSKFLYPTVVQMDSQKQFGNRFLTDPRKVFQHNSWDDVEWDEEYEAEALQKVEKNSENGLTPEMSEQLDVEANAHWNKFYDQHQNRFFKDRQWLFKEFPELLRSNKDTDQHISNKDPNESNKSDFNLETPQSSELSRTENDNTLAACADISTVDSVSLQTMPETNVPIKLSTTSSGSEANIETNFSKPCSNVFTSESNDSTKSKQISESKVTNLSSNDKSLVCGENNTFPGEHGTYRVFEVGCGVGNTVFPVLQTNNDSQVFVYCCDLSSTAIEILQQHYLYDEDRCHAFVGDVTKVGETLPFPENSLDVVTLIFILSAVSPDKMQTTLNRLARCLKPGGILLFRDYGRYDLCQLRFKQGQCLSDNFYARQDGTRVYFFTQDEVRDMFVKAGLIEVQNIKDRRLQVNRAKQLKMHRVWIQCKYKKPITDQVS